MIPSAYRLMHEFPKTINGKIDKEALSIDMEDVITRDKQETKSLTPIERKILDVWFDVLKTKDILINDNFFDIGGNSLLAITVFSKIESIFNVELGLRIFFDSPRIIDLAEAIDFAIQKPAEKKQDDKIPHSKQNIISGEI